MKESMYKNEIKRSFIYSFKRMFYDSSFFAFIINSFIFSLLLCLLLSNVFSMVPTYGGSDFLNLCEQKMADNLKTYQETNDVVCLENYQYFSLLFENKINPESFYAFDKKGLMGYELSASSSFLLKFISFIPFLFCILCLYPAWCLFFSSESKNSYKNVIPSSIHKNSFIIGKIFFYFLLILINYILFFIIAIPFSKVKTVLLFNGDCWELTSIYSLAFKRSGYGVVTSFTIGSLILIFGTFFKKGLDFGIFLTFLSIALCALCVFLNISYPSFGTYILGVGENMDEIQKITPSIIRVFEGVFVICLSLILVIKS